MLNLDTVYHRAKVSHSNFLSCAIPITEKPYLNKLRYHVFLLQYQAHEVLKNGNGFP